MATRRALICEDDAAIRLLVKTVVVREGFEVDVEPDGGGGLEKMRIGCYDLVILDLMMPQVDGYEVIRFMEKERPATLKKLIVMTAVSDVLKDDFPEPICTVLAKPFSIEELTLAVRSCAQGCEGPS